MKRNTGENTPAMPERRRLLIASAGVAAATLIAPVSATKSFSHRLPFTPH